MKNKILIILLIFILFYSNLKAETADYGPAILRIMNSAYMIGSGGTSIGSVYGIDGLFTNPSFILNADCLEISSMHLMWMREYNLEYLSGIYPASVGSFGLGLIYFHQPEDFYIGEYGEQTGLVLNKSDLGFFISYARQIFKIPLGITARYIHHKLVDNTGSSILFDIGGKQVFIADKGILLFGLGIKNLGVGPKFIDERTDLPIQIPLDIGYKLRYNIMDFGIYTVLNIYFNDDFAGGFGTELGFFEKYKIRAGYRFGYEMLSFSLGAGMIYNIQDIDLQLDYGFIMGQGLGATHNIQLTAKFWSIGKMGAGVITPKKLDFDTVIDFFKGDTSVKVRDEAEELVARGIEVRIETAEASSVFGSDEAENACDGSESTRWDSEHQKDPQWIIFILEKGEIIRGMKIRWEAAAAKRYDILVSLDKKNWKKVASINDGESNQERIIKFVKPVKAKYVKVFGKERCGDWGYSIWEVKIYK